MLKNIEDAIELDDQLSKSEKDWHVTLDDGDVLKFKCADISEALLRAKDYIEIKKPNIIGIKEYK